MLKPLLWLCGLALPGCTFFYNDKLADSTASRKLAKSCSVGGAFALDSFMQLRHDGTGPGVFR